MGEAAEGVGEELDDFQADTEDDYDGDDNVDDVIEEVLNETVAETVERSAKEAREKEKSDPQEGKPTGGEAPKHESGTEVQTKPTQPAPSQTGHVEAPRRLSAEGKAAWEKADPIFKKEYARAIQDLEAGQQQKIREIHQREQEVKHVVDAVAPWAKDWATMGISPGQGMALLAKTHAGMVENPAKELARLAVDNNVTAQQIQAHIDGKGDNGQGGTGFGVDISQHPQFRALQGELESLKNDRRQEMAQAETDKLLALRSQVDDNGNHPYEDIASQAFVNFAQPLVNALRQPPRDPNTGQYVRGPVPSIFEAYKQVYDEYWLPRKGYGTISQNQATNNQPRGAQPVRSQPAKPVSMRPRQSPAGKVPSTREDTSRYLHETVEQTMARQIRNNWQY